MEERDPNPYNEEWKAKQEKLWPGFTIVCDICQSHDVTLTNTMGYSAESGGWGSIDLVCERCHNSTELVEA